MTDTYRNRDVARGVFERLDYGRSRGHDDYCKIARRNEDFFLGAGLQWAAEDRAELEAAGRPVHEVNEIMPAIKSIIGYQIQNRMDAGLIPKGGGATESSAKMMAKALKHVMDTANYRFAETDVFTDGIIQQRGFLDIRLGFEDSDSGDVCYHVLDPMDVIPDPDAKHIDPDKWADVLETRWLTANEMTQDYGKAASDEVVARMKYIDEEDWGEAEANGAPRGKFGDRLSFGYGYGATFTTDKRTVRYRIVHRQLNVYEQCLVGRWPSGDFRILEGVDRERIGQMIEAGVYVTKRKMRRVRFEVAAPELTIHEGISPYRHISIVPYFPIFRRGRTRGSIDNAISPQEMKNKATSQFLHIVNTMANSGWQVPENTLKNMSPEELEDRGAETGLVVVFDNQIGPAQKIEPNPIPQGVDAIIDMATNNLRSTIGVNESLQGTGPQDMSGIAIQSRQFAAQQALAPELDSLSRFRRMVAQRTLEIIQTNYITERVFSFAETEPMTGTPKTVELIANQVQDDGTVLNDLTVGEYGLAITEQPMQITFENSQFDQAMQMKEKGVGIPDSVLIRYSNLSDKEDIAAAMQPSAPPPDPEAEANAALKLAQAQVASATAVNKSIESIFSATRAGQAIAIQPAVAGIADQLLRSAGFQDKDAAPIVTQAPEGLDVAPLPNNTNPLTPDNPGVGLNTGIESGLV